MQKSLIFIASILFALDLAVCTSLIRLQPINPGLRLHLLDVGQGDSILITTPEQHHILVDGGPGNSVILELAESLPYLFAEIDLLVLTHPHADHVEGLIPVLDRFEVGAILLSAPAYNNLAYETFLEKINGMQIFIADDDTDFQLGSTVIDVLYPFEPFSGEEVSNVNNVSPVLMISDNSIVSNNSMEPNDLMISSDDFFNDDFSETDRAPSRGRILLTGDAETEVEEAVLATGLNLSADILKAGHHGSKTASSLEFLEAVDPEILLISVGEGNSFGHPHEETLERAADLDIEVLRTDLEGRISFIFEDFDSINFTSEDFVFEEDFGENKKNEDKIGHTENTKIISPWTYPWVYSWTRSIFAPKLRSFSSSRS